MMWYFKNIFLHDWKWHSLRIAVNNWILLKVMDFIGAKGFKITYEKHRN